MTSIDYAIMCTVLYADVFDYPLTPPEIQHYLIHHQPTSLQQIQAALHASPELCENLVIVEGYVTRRGRESIVEQRKERDRAAQELWPLALHYGRLLACLPFVRMVALTGALAVRNVSSTDDDLDYLLITSANRVWLARAFAIVLVRAARWRGVTLCPNYVLAESALEQQRKDLFIAHEIAQMVPIYGHEVYHRFRAMNTWAGENLPNAEQVYFAEADYPLTGLRGRVKGLGERLLSGRLGDWLEQWEYRRKLRRFAPELTQPDSAAELDEQRVKGHFQDYGHPVLRQYRQRLDTYGLLNRTPGD